MRKGTQVTLSDDSELRRRLGSLAPRNLPRTGASGVVVATRPHLDDSVLIKFVGYAELISLRTQYLTPVAR